MEGRRGLRRRWGAGSGLFLSWEGRPKEGGCGCHLLHPSPSPTSKKPWPTESLSQGPPPRFFHFFPAWGPTLGQVATVSHLDHCRATSLDPRCQPGPLHPVLHTQLNVNHITSFSCLNLPKAACHTWKKSQAHEACLTGPASLWDSISNLSRPGTLPQPPRLPARPWKAVSCSPLGAGELCRTCAGEHPFFTSLPGSLLLVWVSEQTSPPQRGLPWKTDSAILLPSGCYTVRTTDFPAPSTLK